MRHLSYLFLTFLYSASIFAQTKSQEELEGARTHQYLMQNNLVPLTIDSTTFVKAISNNSAFKGSSIMAASATSAFDDGDFSQWGFNLGFTLGGQPNPYNYHNCFFQNYDPTDISKPADLRDKFHVFNSNDPTISDGFYNTHILPSASNVSLPTYFLRLGNYSLYQSITSSESFHTSTSKWTGSGGCSNTSLGYGGFAEKATFTITVDNANKFFEYYYSVASSPPTGSGHDGFYAPFFSISMFNSSGTEIICAKNFQIFTPGFNVPGYTMINNNTIAYRPWTRNYVDLSSYVGTDVVVKLEVKHCAPNGHFGVLYFAAKSVEKPLVKVNAVDCDNFNFAISGYNKNYSTESTIWNFGDGTGNQTQSGDSITHNYVTAGNYIVTTTSNYTTTYLSTTNSSPGSYSVQIAQPCSISFTTEINTTEIAHCDSISCIDCIGSFAPVPGNKYVISAWVKEQNPSPSKTNYTYPSLKIKYPSINDSSDAFFASGAIIDGWQRIEGEFIIPALSTDISIRLKCSTGNCFFDDIRIFPTDGSMKSYVYDPVNMRLVAELDERNYATFYEYDEEGKLIRLKKETERGIMTIRENRNNSKK